MLWNLHLFSSIIFFLNINYIEDNSSVQIYEASTTRGRGRVVVEEEEEDEADEAIERVLEILTWI